jgi:hypothetical protein
MNTFNFSVPLISISGEEVKDQTLAKVLSNTIATQIKGKTLKLYGWHKTLQVGDPLILDESDTEDLKKLIEADENLYIYVKGQLLGVLAL